MKKCVLIGLCIVLLSSCREKTLFTKIDSSSSGIRFTNSIRDNDTLNVLDVENIYNGGGVGIGDFNNDGLQDIYFTGNMVANSLYINEGDFEFKDVTEQAGVEGEGKWCRGVTVVDINNDGWMDIYVSATISNDSLKRKNLLYINQGKTENGIPRFKNLAAEYGLDDNTHSTMAYFFDYDNDSDLDIYLVVNQIIKNEYPNTYRHISKKGEHPSTGRLYRNDFNAELKHPVFTNVSKEAGITIEGYGHSATVTDINQDGWIDIYVANDFIPNNILYINNHDGTFTDQVMSYFKHTSANSMGQDIIDINNDGLVDVIEVDMNPEDNFRKKMMLNPNSYQSYRNSEYFGYQYQYVRNVLQLNQGPRIEGDSLGAPVFSDIGFLSGIAETDWSWTPLVIDFDNDGFRDIIITNGFPKDVTDHDFITFRNKAYSIAEKKDILEQIPEVKIANYAYRNNGDLTFKKVTNEWGFTTPSFSNGAAYADFDNDGDLDMVINNINEEAFLYRNEEQQRETRGNYLQIQFAGGDKNLNGIGAIAELHYQGKTQVYENTPYRGYLSTNQNIAHFGLGNIERVEELVIRWGNGLVERKRNVPVNTKMTVNIKDARPETPVKNKPASLLKDITNEVGISYIHKDDDYIDFNIQKLLPHKFSEYGPGLAVGDVDGNGTDDLVCGGSYFYPSQVFLQQHDGRFIRRPIGNALDSGGNKKREETGVLLFDADTDGDLDLYLASGGFEADRNTESYVDRLYLNDGKGNFQHLENGLPGNRASKFCVRASDYDKDGDLDLFVAGRVDPWYYPRPTSSKIYRNDSKPGKVSFADVTSSIAKGLDSIGLVCDAVFSDIDNDGWQDLVVAGEWMPLKIFKNSKGNFSDITNTTGLENNYGWWNSLLPGDFDNDGDIDYIAGNLGTNSFYRASHNYPVMITAKDFDNNGSYDAIPSLYLQETLQDSTRKEFPAPVRDDIVKQMVSMRTKFVNYKLYATATMDEVLNPEQLKGAVRLHANYLQSSFIRNNGNGKFETVPLPVLSQLSVICGMSAEDIDGDGNLDVIINGNDYGTDVGIGRYDALNGLVLKGDGRGQFKPMSIASSGLYIPGNGKALVTLKRNEELLFAASENKGPLKIFKTSRKVKVLKVEPNDESAIIRYADGKTRKQEINYGSSYLSQSGRSIVIDDKVISVEVTNSKNEKRMIVASNNQR